MMWLMEIKNLPQDVIDASRNPLARERDVEILRRHSSSLYAVGEGRELKLVVGVLPPTLLSGKAFLWMLFLDGVGFAKWELRAIKQVFPKFLDLFGLEFYAEVLPESRVRDTKFLSFCGFEKFTDTEDSEIFRRAA